MAKSECCPIFVKIPPPPPKKYHENVRWELLCYMQTHGRANTKRLPVSTRNCFASASEVDTTDSTVFLLQVSESEGPENLAVLQHVAHVFFITNFGINFLLYCVSGQNFRRAFCSLCCSCARCPSLRRSS